MRKLLRRLTRAARRAREIAAARRAGGLRCGTCGFAGAPRQRDALWPELVEQWGLTPQWARWFDEREGSCCVRCGSSRRSAQLASAIVRTINASVGTSASCLSALFRDRRARDLAIAEINSAGNLHRYLARCRGLRYSEFGSRDAGIGSEDLTRLSYADESFDLVITSDTLEHVPERRSCAARDAARAQARRGACLHDAGGQRPTDAPARRAARQPARAPVPPSYHGAPGTRASDFLVFHEFGADFTERCRAAGFALETLADERNPALVTFIARRPS